MASPTLREWLSEGDFSLAMSSGFFGFFAHAGMLVALEDAGVLPARVSGSSAGALVGGLWAAGVDGVHQRDVLMQLQREDFWDPGVGLGLLKGRLFSELLADLLPVRRFEDCRAPAIVSVFDVLSRRTRVIDRGPLAPAIQASCTLPGLFQPLWHQGRPLLDGGVLDRPGIEGLAPGERVLHHHLASRSPWRRRGSDSLKPPRRAGLHALVVMGLQRLGPFRLHLGKLAFEQARDATRRALNAPLEPVMTVDAR
ncbi:MAG: patatin-like phospholipase family protein [Polyangiaceae bacterium]